MKTKEKKETLNTIRSTNFELEGKRKMRLSGLLEAGATERQMKRQ